MSTENGKKLKIDVDMFQSARDDNSGEADWFLDLETGNVVMYYDGMLDGEDVDDDFDIESYDADERFLRIPPAGSRDGYRLMEAFIESLPDGRGKDSLQDAIDRPKPFRRFKDALFELGDTRDQWFKFEEEAKIADAIDWLHTEGIEADFSR